MLAPWPAPPLTSRDRVVLRVRVTGRSSEAPDAAAGTTAEAGSPTTASPADTGWSEPIAYEVGLLDPADWRALPVGPSWPENPLTDRRPPFFVFLSDSGLEPFFLKTRFILCIYE